MNSLTYLIDGKTFNLTTEEYRPFNNNDKWNRVDINSNTVFKLKDGETISGIVKNIMFTYPVDGSDNPLQTKFNIESENRGVVALGFYEIEFHRPAPFKKIPCNR